MQLATRPQKSNAVEISGNIREVLIFANFVRRTNLRIQESHENDYNRPTKEK